MPDKTIEQLKTEIRAEILREQAREAEQRKINSHTFTKVLNEFKDDFNKLNWSESGNITRSYDGTTYPWTNNHYEAYKVKTAIGALVKATFRVNSPAKIPASKAPQLRKIMQNILNVVLSEVSATEKAA